MTYKADSIVNAGHFAALIPGEAATYMCGDASEDFTHRSECFAGVVSVREISEPHAERACQRPRRSLTG